MKRLLVSLLAALAFLGIKATESALHSQVMLTPYVVHDNATPRADKVLLDKLDRIVTKYGVSASGGLQSPFIITGHAVELDRETTATAPSRTIVDLSFTLYVGNGEEGTVFSTCNLNLRGVGATLDDAYASAFKKLKVDDPQIDAAIIEGRNRIAQYYAQAGPGLIRQARAQQEAGNYADAYAILLRIPPVCPQYEEAQDLVIKYVQMEASSKNSEILARARAAWSASPDENGAAQASSILAEMTNVSPELRTQSNALMKEMATRLQKAEDSRMAAEAAREQAEHQERMASIKGATKVAVAYASRPVYHIHWW